MTDILARAEKFLKNENDSLAYAFVAEKRGVHLIEQLLAEAKAWKAKAIRQYAIRLYESSGGGEIWEAVIDKYEGLAAKELAEEMRNGN